MPTVREEKPHSEKVRWLEHLERLPPEEFLANFEVRAGSPDSTHSRLFLLGCLNRHITVYSQQTRAGISFMPSLLVTPRPSTISESP